MVNLGFPGCAADAVLMVLDAAGFDCSAGSACSAGVARPSHVLTAMGLDDADARPPCASPSAGQHGPADVAALLAVLPDAVARARAAAAFV